MKIIKNINNNFAIAVDGAGNQLIVSGKGIGFGTVPREIKDLTIINRSYYDVDEMYISMIQDLPKEIIEISGKIVDKVRLMIENPISSNIVFTLADHINFSIQRYQKNMNLKLPIMYDIQHLFEKEVEIGNYGLKLIQEQLNIHLPKEEAAYIALHIINAEEQTKNKKIKEDEKTIYDITKIIETEFNLEINKDNFNYSRFVSHMYYLLKRGKTKHLLFSDNNAIYEKLKTDYQKTHDCVNIICQYLSDALHMDLTDEEKLYLMLHVNRLCTREDCNQ